MSDFTEEGPMPDDEMRHMESLCARARSPITLTDDGEPLVYLPDGVKLHSVEKFLPMPIRIRRSLNVTTLEAFTRYFNLFQGKTGDSRIFADLDKVTAMGILDDHIPDGPEGFPQAMWGSHRVTYQCPYSREWKAWTEHDRKQMSQVEFAEWLEDRIHDVTVPDGGELMDLATQLHIIRKATFGSTTRLASGETSFQYAEENQSGTVEIPAVITLGIPVFVGGTAYEVKARFKYRLREGVLTLSYELIEPAKYVEDAFAEVVETIEADTNVAPFSALVGSLST